MPKEAAGLENIVPALLSVFDHADVLALGEDHLRRLDSDLRIALVRHPDFPRRARFIMVEFGTDLHQTTLDRYVGGEEVSAEELRQVWATTTTGQWDSPVYADFFAAVREVNAKVSPAKRIRVLAGDPGKGVKIPRDDWAVSTLRQQVLEKGEKALVIYGAGHFFRTRAGQYPLPPGIGGISKSLDADYPGRTFVVVTLGGEDPKYESFERALQTSLRPVLVSLQRLPSEDSPQRISSARKCSNGFQEEKLNGSFRTVVFGLGNRRTRLSTSARMRTLIHELCRSASLQARSDLRLPFSHKCLP